MCAVHAQVDERDAPPRLRRVASITPTAVTRALRHSHDTLRSVVEPLDAEGVRAQSYASEWSIAQVLSHLGSGAENFTAILDAGLRGQPTPGREAMEPVWDRWNAKTPDQQAADALVADSSLVERIEALDDEQRRDFHVHLFGRDVDVDGFTRMRLGEHAIHTWDVAVMLDPTATLPHDAVDEMVDTLAPLVGYTAKPAPQPRRTAW